MAGKKATGWVGWIWFGAIMLMVVGILNVLSGLVAVVKQDASVYINDLTTTANGTVEAVGNLLVFDVSGWGWVHLILGIVLFVVSFFLFTGKMWARIVAVVLIILNIVSQILYLPATPIWSVVVLVLDVLVMWAILVHGDEAAITD